MLEFTDDDILRIGIIKRIIDSEINKIFMNGVKLNFTILCGELFSDLWHSIDAARFSVKGLDMTPSLLLEDKVKTDNPLIDFYIDMPSTAASELYKQYFSLPSDYDVGFNYSSDNIFYEGLKNSVVRERLLNRSRDLFAKVRFILMKDIHFNKQYETLPEHLKIKYSIDMNKLYISPLQLQTIKDKSIFYSDGTTYSFNPPLLGNYWENKGYKRYAKEMSRTELRYDIPNDSSLWPTYIDVTDNIKWKVSII